MDLAMLGIGVDSRKVKTAENDLESLSRQAKKTENSVKAFADEYNKTADDAAKNSKRVISNLKFEFEQIGRTAKQQQLYNELRKAGVSLDSTAGQEIKKLTDKIHTAETATGKMAAGFKNASSSVAAFGTTIAALGLGVFAKEVFQASAALERIKNSLKAATGSSELAAKELGFVRTEADRLGLNLEKAALAYGQLSAASKGTAMQAGQVRRIFTSVSEASTVLGLTADDAQGALRAISQMMSKGTVQAEELRGQLGERIPGAFQIAARAMGKTTAELGEMLEQGQVISDDFLPKFAVELQKTFSNALPDALNSANANFNRLETAIFDLKTEVGASGFMDAAVIGIEGLADAIGGLNLILKDSRELLGGLDDSGFLNEVWEGYKTIVSYAPVIKIPSLLADYKNKNKAAGEDYAGIKIPIGDRTKNAGETPVDQKAVKKIKDDLLAQNDAIEKIIESLKFEQAQLNKTTIDQRISNELRRAGVAAMSAQGQAISALVTQIETETAAKKAAEEEDARIRKAAGDAQKEYNQKQADETAKRFDEFKQQIKDKSDLMAKLNADLESSSIDFPGQTSFGDPLSEGIGQAVEAMNRLNLAYEKEKSLLLENEEIKNRILEQTLAGSAKQEKLLSKLAKKELKENEIVFKSQLSGYRELFGTTKELFGEQSKERKKLHQIEQAFAAIEIALNLKKALTSAVGAIANQGSGDPYTAFARIAAMIGLMGSVLAMAGGSLGGGGSSSGGGSAAPVGTVLGDQTAQSESVSKGYELLKDIHAEEYGALRGILAEMKDLNDNITGLVSNIVRNFGSFDESSMGVKVGEFNSKLADTLVKSYVQSLTVYNLDFMKKIDPLSAFVNDFTSGILNKAVNGIFGGSSKTTMTAAGLSVGDANVGEILAGMDADIKAYTKLRTKTDGGWFSSDKTSYKTIFSKVDASITGLFTTLFEGIGNSALEISKGLGVDLSKKIKDYTLEVGKINLKGKTGDEIAQIIGAKISEASDKMIEDIFGSLVLQYQQINEGVFETAIRLIAEKAVILDALDKSALRITGDIIAITQSISTLAGGIEEFQDIFNTYYDKFYSDVEKQANLQKSLISNFSEMNMILPTTRDGYRAIVESLNLNNEADRKRYVTLLNLSEAADSYYTGLEDGFETLVSNVKTYVSELTSLSNSVKSALNTLFGTTLNADSERASSKTVLSQAIESFKRTGKVDNVSEIQSALGVVSNLTANSFASFEDYQREFFKSVGLIKTLGTLTDAQLSIEERLLAAIEEQTGTEETQHTEAMARLDAIRAAVLGEPATSVPGFAAGGRHAGGWRVVGENGPELEYTGPSQIVGNSASSALIDNRELIEEVKRLRVDLAASQFVIAKNGKDMVKIIDRWDVNGLPETRTA